MADEVTLEPATSAHHVLLSNLLELYIHDLSEIFDLKPGADGRFGYDELAHYWSEPDTHFAYLIRSGEDVAGFALIARGSPASDDPDVIDVHEFFVLRSFRRGGIARRAAFLLWDRTPARWVVRVSERNLGALPFWEGAIRDYARGAFTVKQHPGKTHMFRVFEFSNAA
ncbi:MAG: GNAT family N-acetyltransferase [bacterium]